MKNKVKYLLYVILMCPFYVSAAEVSLSCPSSVNSGESVTCSININSGSEYVAGFEASINAGNGLTYKSYSPSSGWAGTSTSSNFLVYGNKVNGSKTLGKYVYTAKGNPNDKLTISLKDISVSNENGNAISSNSSASATIRIKCNDNNLKSLTVDGLSVSGFNKDTLTYNMTTEKTSINIAASASSSYAKISGTGKKTVNYGKNVYDVVVTSESGSKKIYKINVTRPDNRETINTLSSLSVVGYTINPSFSSKTNTYKLNVDSSVSSISIKATRTSLKSSFVSGFGERSVKLDYGDNNILVKVKAENEKINTYTIVVNRKDNRSSNNYLRELTVKEGNIKFDKNTLNYSLVTDTDSVEITAIAEDLKAKVSGGGKITLKDGINVILVVVTAENNSTRQYTIQVTKTDDLSSFVSSNNLSALKVNGYSINLSNDNLEYEVNTNDDKLDLDYILEDNNSNIEILGNENLNDGSVVTLKVTASDGNVKEYKLKVSKQNVASESKSSSNTLLIVLLIISVIGNIVLLILFITKKNKVVVTDENNVNEKSNE